MFERDMELEGRLGGLFVRATKYGDEAAMDVVMEYSIPALTERVSRWCDKKGHSRGFAEIVACATMMKALMAAKEFDPNKPLMGWLAGIAWNEFIDLYRVEKRLDERHESLDLKLTRPIQGKNARVEDQRDAERLAIGMTPPRELVCREEEACRERQLEMLDAAIRSLPDLKRQVVELYRAGNSVGVIAGILAMPQPRISKLLFDAKAELRRRTG
jgi:RNA polymerase sigma factor (sigma-70 family)